MPIPFLVASGIAPDIIIRKYLRDSNGGIDMNVLGRNRPPVEFTHTVPDGSELLLLGITFILIDKKVDPNKFGDIDILDNGVTFEFRDGSGATIIDLTDGVSIKRNADFVMIDSGVFSRLDGNANSLLSTSWKASGDSEPIILQPLSQIVMGVRDDLRKVELFRAIVKGRLVPL